MGTFFLVLSVLSFWTSGWIAVVLMSSSQDPFSTTYAPSGAGFLAFAAFFLSAGAISSILDIAWYWALLLNIFLSVILGLAAMKLMLHLFSSGTLAKDYVQAFFGGLLFLVIGLIL